jgi:hypothetical protein
MPKFEVPTAPTESDRRAAQAALEQDFADLASEEAQQLAADEKARNDALEAKLGGAAAARAEECERLRLQLQELNKLDASPDLENALRDTQERIAAQCR